MPYITVNQTQLYYEVYGQDSPGRLPVVLIHGSTVTGRADWALVAPLLAREYRVIVPDCRGHGQSANPRHSYSFREMATDIAELVKALGYPRAHIIGHSNGGNVALVMLLEHPEVVQTAILQAANAYVSPDLVAKEPAIFDPDRVARENPAWMNEMIALHGPLHGPEYWRELLRLTVQELISEPNYTPEDLGKVDRAVLVIQGELDRVNAPARHAQFIAQHIPQADLWIPPGIGHNVHLEMLFPWVERVMNFLAQRGDDANEALVRLRRKHFADERETVFQVTAHDKESLGEGGKTAILLTGQVLTAPQAQAAVQAVSAVRKGSPVASEIRVLLDDFTPWALVKRSVTDMRREPGNRSERVSQALMGEAVRVLEERGEWSRVRLEKDGYLGWVHTQALYGCSRAEVEAYRAACNHLVKADLAAIYHSPIVSSWGTISGGQEASKLPFGLPVAVVEWKHGAAGIQTPDGSLCWVSDWSLLPVQERPQPDPQGIAFTLSLIRRFVGIPYLWGGRTPFGYDCSGLAQTFLNFLGIHAPRDADQQFRAGIPLKNSSEGTNPVPQPGDLLFFGEKDEEASGLNGAGDLPYGRDRRITHVAISLGEDELIHANGASWSVAYNSLNPRSPIYFARLRERLVGVRRFWGEEN